MESVIAAWENPNDRERVFAIEPKQTGRIAGLIRIAIDAEADNRGNIGYSLDRDFQGSGYATEAAREVVRLGFEELGLSRIRAIADTRNDKSWKLLERAGFRREKRMAGHMSIRGTSRDAYLYAILKR